MSNILDQLQRQVLLCDGAMGTQVQVRDLDIDSDFMGKENCTEVLNLSRPDVVRDIHTDYLKAGSDLIQTNTFGGSPLTLAEFDLEDQAFEINRLAGNWRTRRLMVLVRTANHDLSWVPSDLAPACRLWVT